MIAETYDKAYYLSHCGIPYHRDEPHWHRFFGDVARGINQSITPKTVFDAGCAIGFLVETLREQGIEAFGRDISKYAIEQVPVGLKAYVEQGSISDPIDGTFDLVTCIEVLEHMPADEGRKAVENLCRAAPKVLFSSSPNDFTEETHINVQPPIYWMRLFADFSFGPVAYFDGSFLCPWAVLFERREIRPTDSELEAQARLIQTRMDAVEAVRGAHRNNHEEVSQLTAQTAQRAAEIAQLTAQTEQQAAEIAQLTAQTAQRAAEIAQLTAQTEQQAAEIAQLTAQTEQQAAEIAQLTAQTEQQAAEIARFQTSCVELKAQLVERDTVENERSHWIWKRLSVASKRERKQNELKAQEDMIRRSGLFDMRWYLDEYPDIADAAVDAVHHYLSFGASEGRNPNRVFDTSYYLAAYPEVSASGLNPLLHYLTIGAKARLKPSAEFDPVWYCKTYPDAVGNGTDPLLHYLHHGQAEGRGRFAGDGASPVFEASIEIVKAPEGAEELVLFVTHAPGGRIKPHVLVHVDELRKVGLSVCVIVAADDINAVGTDVLLDRVDGLFLRKNGGYDFAAWAHAARMINLSDTQLLVLTNDSIIGPFSTAAMQKIATRIRDSKAQLIGLTDNREIRYHLQSYFLAAKGAGVAVMVDFLTGVQSFRHKQDVIANYETTVLDAFKAHEMKEEVLFPNQGNANRTTTEWRELIKEGFPFLKVEVLKSYEAEGWKELLLEAGYDVRVAEESLEILRSAVTSAAGKETVLQAPNEQALADFVVQPAGQHVNQDRVALLEQELTKARKKPGKLVWNKLEFKLYKFLAQFTISFSSKLAAKYSKRAHKRHPRKFETNFASTHAVMSGGSGTATLYKGHLPHDPSKANVLIISHQASRTGAPILALNVAQGLSKRYNVTSICMSGGELMEDFAVTCESAYDAGVYSMNPDDYADLLKRVCREQQFDFAVTNSVETHAFLKGLRDQGVPTVALLHEFASYTQDKGAFYKAVGWADETVFSSSLTLENALDTGTIYMSPRLHIQPQGRCLVPSRSTDGKTREAERTRLRNLFRSFGAATDGFVVLGAGTIEIRKGVDLFIEVANRVLHSQGGKSVQFIWVGAGYNPDAEFGYSVYLRDQIKRAGIEENVRIIPSTTEIELAYELSDVFLLSSRLDPLPNVAIDSMSLGLPVVCFDKASGAAPLLETNGLADSCVADYLDAGDAADKIIKLRASRSYYADVAERTRSFAKETFDLEGYVNKIEALGLTAKARAENAEADKAEIVSSGTMRADFFQPPGERSKTMQHLAEDYLTRQGWAIGMRKPEPGFDPFVYAACREDFDPSHDPYAAFLRAGRPEGPWMLPVLEGGPEALQDVGPSSLKTALHIHAYFLDELPLVVERLLQNRSRPELFISVADEYAVDKANATLDRYNGKVAAVRVVPNRGRDIGAFLTEFGRDLADKYEVVGHIHLKQSAHLDCSTFVANWNTFTLENLLGGTRGGTMMDVILDRFGSDDAIGMIFPDDPNILGWTRNKPRASELARKMGYAVLPEAINFPVGTMFWMRARVLRSFVDLGLDWDEYPAEPIDIDGTNLHALERLFGVVPRLSGWKTMVTNIRGITR